MRFLRKSLDKLYLLGGLLGAVSMIAILLLVCAQMVARWTGTTLSGAANYASYFMAASTFFALAYSLNHGAHIRVTLFLKHIGPLRRIGEIWCYGISAVFMSFFTWAAIERNLQSFEFNSLSQGQDATPLWIPEISMSFGAALLALAFWDHLVRMLFSDYMGISEELPLEEHAD